MRAALEWLQDRVKGGLIARAESRDEALTHFLNGETAIFMDWQSAYNGLYARELEKNGVEIVEMPYPSSTGFVIRSFELTAHALPRNGQCQTRIGYAGDCFLA